MDSTSDRPCSYRTPGAATAIGPVTAHRIRQIRRRIRLGRYPVDSVTLAAEIAGHDSGCAAYRGSVSIGVNRLLSGAIDRLDHAAAMILQLEFIEQLAVHEIAFTVGSSTDAVASARRAALLKLKMLLDGSLPTADCGASR